MSRTPLLALLILAAPGILPAQALRPVPGSQLRVTLRPTASWHGMASLAAGPNEGRFVSVPGDSLRLTVGWSADTTTVALAHIERVQGVVGVRNRHILESALIGLVLGTGLTAATCKGYGCIGVPVAGIGGALISALVAGAAPREVWRDIPIDSLRQHQ